MNRIVFPLLLFPFFTASAEAITCTGGEIPAGSGEDLEITGACVVPTGTYHFANVNVHSGGSLIFNDVKIDFWANSILVENRGRVSAGSPTSPIGANGGLVTIHLYGKDQGKNGTGITCRTGPQCGIDDATWTAGGNEKMPLPGGVNDYFYKYMPLMFDGGDANGYFGYKVLAVSFGGRLELYGQKGSTFTQTADSDSGRSWVRLDGSIAVGATSLKVSRPVDWQAGDRIVVTTTDYLPGHSEELTIASIAEDGMTITFNEPLRYPHNGKAFDLSGVPPGIGPDPLPGEGTRAAETRAAVALLSRSIRIVSAGDNFGEDFPPEATGYYFGGHIVIRQGFESVKLQGVEMYQLGQGGRMGHYPIHFHLARQVPQETMIADCSIHDSMTRWITLHATQGVALQRNVGYKSIGHGFYLEDGTEINNRFYSNIGIFARAAVDNVQNPRKVPGILAKPFPDFSQPQEAVPLHSDIDHPTVFWITNGWNDFAYNMAAGAGTCGACYWLVPTSNSGLSRNQVWESYAAMQQGEARAAMTPLYRFEGNYCSTAMNSFNTIGNATPCNGVVNQDPGADLPQLSAVPNPYLVDDDMYPKVDTGGGRFGTRCPDNTACSQVPKCSSDATENCMVTVLDRYTTQFNWAETNFSAVWLRPQWYLLLNSVISDVQNGGLTFVTGGGYTKSDVVDGHWALARKTAFIGNSQDPADNPFASNAGPFNPRTPLRCAPKTNSPASAGLFCLSQDEGISMPMTNFGVNQRLFNIYDGPAYQESNAYLNIRTTVLEDCQPQPNGGICADSKYMYGQMTPIPKDAEGNCYLPNAGIGWKQPNGFYYPPAFHSENLFFNDVDIRHFVVQPLFSGHYQTDSAAAAQRYCTWNSGIFNNFTDVDRQTELNDDDGSLTGLVKTVSVNTDPFFRAPIATPQCASDVASKVPPGTASTSPYEYVTTAMVAECGLGCANWAVACADPTCYGVPLYRQYSVPEDGGSHYSIRMAGQATAQRSSLTVNHSKYYIDTTVSAEQQTEVASNLNVFHAGQTYYTFLLFAKPTTRQTYQMYVGPGFDVSTGVFMARAMTGSVPVGFVRENWPTTWPQPVYDSATGLLTVTMDMSFPEFQSGYDQAAQKCQPRSFCSWNAAAGSCGSALDPSDKLFAESQQVCSKWPMKDVDCPVGGCYSFGVTLPAGFTTGPKPNLPPPPEPFPTSPEWMTPFTTATEGVAGRQCYYATPPSPR